MASNLPVPAPPRTPTPPPDDQPQSEYLSGLGLDGFLNSPAKSSFDPNSLSPMDENFPTRSHRSTNGMGPPPLLAPSPTDTNSLSPMSIDSAGSQTSVMVEDGKGVFQFQPTTLSKSPITKSVGISFELS